MELHKGLHKLSGPLKPGDEIEGENRSKTILDHHVVYEGIGKGDTYIGGRIENLTVNGDLVLYQTRSLSIRDLTVNGYFVFDGGIEGSAYNCIQNVVAKKGYVLRRTNPKTENPWTNINRFWGIHTWGADVGLDLISGTGNDIFISVGGCRIGVHLQKGADVNRLTIMEEYSRDASIIVDQYAMRNRLAGSWQKDKMSLPHRWEWHKTIIDAQFASPYFETGEITPKIVRYP